MPCSEPADWQGSQTANPEVFLGTHDKGENVNE